MIINFDQIEEKHIPNFNGGKKEFVVKMFTDEAGKIMKGKLAPGASIGLHKHEANAEIQYILSGSGYFICDGVKEVVQEGMVHYCPKGSSHTLVNNSDKGLVFIGVVR